MQVVTVIVVTIVVHFIRGREMGTAELLGTITGAAAGTAVVAFITVLLSKRRNKHAAY